MAACSHQCMFRHGNQRLIIFLLFFSISTFTHHSFSAQGRVMPKQVEEEERPQKRNVVMVRSLIGSRPPRCESKCRNCGHCEAVQVPIVPIRSHADLSKKKVAFSREDYLSNYKPMCWKCKCGDLIFNP